MLPEEGAISPRMARISVVLPDPLGPSTPMNSPLVDGEADAAEDRPPAEGDGHIPELDGLVRVALCSHEPGPASALPVASSWPPIQA